MNNEKLNKAMDRIMSDGRTTKRQKTFKYQKLADPINKESQKTWKESLKK